MDNEYFNVLNGNMNFQINGKEYFELISTKANQIVRPLTLRLRMKQMKDKMKEEINISKIKHENTKYQQNNDNNSKNIFFLYKKRSNAFNNKTFLHSNEAKSPLTLRNFTQYSPKKQNQQFNKTTLPSSPIIKTAKTQAQKQKNYIKINKQIIKQKGQLNKKNLNLLEQKVLIAKSLPQSSIKFGINSYDQILKTIQELKQNIQEKVIKECNTINQEKQDHKFSTFEKTYTHFLRVLDVIKEMDEQIFQYMLNQKFKHQMNDRHSILEDINKMRDDAYNDKVRTFSKYHDIDQEKKRDRQKLNKVKIYF